MLKKINLTKLELTNYRNIERIVLEFDGDSKIIGENRIGKTNILESIYWLLTDKLLDGSKDISSIKPLADTKREVSVKGYFNVDGKEVVLEKQYGEKWVKTRGTTEVTMQGHYTNYIYNTVSQNTIKAYNELLYEDFGLKDCKVNIDVFQMLINPYFLGNMGESDNWKDLRTLIIDLVGDVTNDEVAAKNPTLAPIKNKIELYNGRIEQLKKVLDSEIKGAKETISSDEAQIKLLEETPNPTDEEVAIAQKGIEEIETKIALLNNPKIDTESAEIEKMINEQVAKINDLEKAEIEKQKANSGTQEIDNKINQLRARQDELLNDKQKMTTDAFVLKNDANKRQATVIACQEARNRFISRLKEIDSNLANIEVSTVCPTCGKPYSAEEIESYKKRIVDLYLDEKNEILSKGKENKAALEKTQANIDQLNSEIEEISKKVKAIDEELQDIAAQIKTLNESRQNADSEISLETEEIKKQKALLEDFKLGLSESKQKFALGLQDNNQKVLEEKAKLEPFKKVLADRDHYLRQQAKLEEVRNNKLEHVTKLAELEQSKELVELFMKTKLQMLDENVSKVFGNIKFQLIKENINGGYDTICKPYIYDVFKDESTSVSWKFGSKSERVITGIAVAECIKSALDLPDLPYLFDEGGEISSDTFAKAFKTDSQLICVKIVDSIMTPMVQSI